jgi:hypothetical protein
MREKYKSAYDPNAFVDPQGYRRAVAEAEAKFQAQFKQEEGKLR